MEWAYLGWLGPRHTEDSRLLPGRRLWCLEAVLEGRGAGAALGGSVPECWGPRHSSRAQGHAWEPLGGASSSPASAEVQVCRDVLPGFRCVRRGGWRRGRSPTEEWGGAGVQGKGAVDRQAEGPCLAERPCPWCVSPLTLGCAGVRRAAFAGWGHVRGTMPR